MSKEEAYWWSTRDIVSTVARELIASGYRRVSRKHRRISRIDKGDWNKAHPYCPDFYRRVYSRDIVVVPRIISEEIPTSQSDDCHFTRLIFLSSEVIDYLKRHAEASPFSILNKPNSIKVRTHDKIYMRQLRQRSTT